MQWRNIIVVWFLTGLWHGASWNFVLWGLYYAVLLVIEKKFLLKAFDSMSKVPRFIVTHIYTLFVTVFGFAVFKFDTDLWTNLGYLFGIGCKGFTDIFTSSVLADNVILFFAAAVLACPVAKLIGKPIEKNCHYSVVRVLKTVAVIAIVALSTVRRVGDTYSPFLYFRF